jgi:hypothetical protein
MITINLESITITFKETGNMTQAYTSYKLEDKIIHNAIRVILENCCDKVMVAAVIMTTTLYVAGCGNIEPINIPTSIATTPTATTTYTPTETATITLTETPTATPLPGTERDAEGIHITFPDGKGVTIPNDQVERRMHIGQGDVLQIWDETNTIILYAYDDKNKVWIEASNVLQGDPSDEEHYIQIKTWDDLIELSRLEKMVLPSFPENTYFPSLNKIFIDYDNPQYKTTEYANTHDVFSGFSVRHPLGIISDHDKLPFRYVNYIHLERGEGRDYSVYIITEQFYNPQDKTFSILHYAFFDDSDKTLANEDPKYKDWGLKAIKTCQESLSNYYYLMPGYFLDQYISDREYKESYVKESGLEVYPNGEVPLIKKLVKEWLTTGKVPEEMETLVMTAASAAYDENKST